MTSAGGIGPDDSGPLRKPNYCDESGTCFDVNSVEHSATLQLKTEQAFHGTQRRVGQRDVQERAKTRKGPAEPSQLSEKLQKIRVEFAQPVPHTSTTQKLAGTTNESTAIIADQLPQACELIRAPSDVRDLCPQHFQNPWQVALAART